MSFSELKGKIVLIENTASLWGTTVRDFTQLNDLCEKYGDKLVSNKSDLISKLSIDFVRIISLWFAITIKIFILLQVVLCFPCNQFGHQENSSGDEIMNALRHVRPGNGFEPKGIMFDKVSQQMLLLWWYYDKNIKISIPRICILSWVSSQDFKLAMFTNS